MTQAPEPDVRENWSVVQHGRATPDEVETAIALISATDAVLAYRIQACFMFADAFAAPKPTDGDLESCARHAGWALTEVVDSIAWEKRGPVVAIIQKLGAALLAHELEEEARCARKN